MEVVINCVGIFSASGQGAQACSEPASPRSDQVMVPSPPQRVFHGRSARPDVLALLALLTWSCRVDARAGEARHGIAMHGEPAMPENFARVPYATPPPRKGGRFVQGVLGTFDSLNPLIVKGIAPPSMRGYVVESLMARGYDEPFSLYGLTRICPFHLVARCTGRIAEFRAVARPIVRRSDRERPAWFAARRLCGPRHGCKRASGTRAPGDCP